MLGGREWRFTAYSRFVSAEEQLLLNGRQKGTEISLIDGCLFMCIVTLLKSTYIAMFPETSAVSQTVLLWLVRVNPFAGGRDEGGGGNDHNDFSKRKRRKEIMIIMGNGARQRPVKSSCSSMNSSKPFLKKRQARTGASSGACSDQMMKR